MSIPNPSLPGIRQPLLDGVIASRPYYLFFQRAATNLQAVVKQLDDLSVRVDGLSDSGLSPNANVTGRYSIRTQGTLSAGIVTVSLKGDVADAGKTQYYGSDATQTKGWYALSDAFTDSGTIEKSVDADGVTSFELVDLPDSGAGALLAITVDGKGRVTGTRDATITGTAGRIDVTHGDASDGVPTIDLAEVPDEGGGTLQKTAFDAYGRRTATDPATSDDLAEGATHLYVTPAQRAVIAALLSSVITTTTGSPIQARTGDLLTVHL